MDTARIAGLLEGIDALVDSVRGELCRAEQEAEDGKCEHDPRYRVDVTGFEGTRFVCRKCNAVVEIPQGADNGNARSQ